MYKSNRASNFDLKLILSIVDIFSQLSVKTKENRISVNNR